MGIRQYTSVKLKKRMASRGRRLQKAHESHNAILPKKRNPHQPLDTETHSSKATGRALPSPQTTESLQQFNVFEGSELLMYASA